VRREDVSAAPRLKTVMLIGSTVNDAERSVART